MYAYKVSTCVNISLYTLCKQNNNKKRFTLEPAEDFENAHCDSLGHKEFCLKTDSIQPKAPPVLWAMVQNVKYCLLTPFPLLSAEVRRRTLRKSSLVQH